MKKAYTLIISAFLFVTHTKGQSCNPLPVPFHEDFQSVTANMQWPACWTATTGTLFSFTSSNGSYAGLTAGGDSYFNSPSFILAAGYTYSASMIFRQNTLGNLWNVVALHLVQGSNQNLGVVASGTNFTTAYSVIGGTFSVANPGTYHLGVQALKASGSPPPTALGFFDDVRIDCADNMIVQSPTVICAGESVQMSAFSAVAYTFQSSNGSSQDNPYIDTPAADETYTVSGLIYGSCVDTRTIAVKVDECLGLKENKLTASLHPNPFNDHVTLQTERGTGTVTIYDSVGNKVYACTVTGVLTDIKLSDLMPGVYVLRFVEGTGQLTMKLICK